MTYRKHILLASASPRRRELLARANYDFEVIVSDADETVPPQLTPLQAAQHTARAKALAVARSAPEDALVIGADTMVVLDGHIYGKPQDASQACEMLRELSGKTHEVITGVCLAEPDHDANIRIETFAEVTKVTFRELSDAEIEAYVDTGEPMDKAGAYGIQGKGGALVDHIEGDFDNVVGLPVTALVERLRALGLDPTHS